MLRKKCIKDAAPKEHKLTILIYPIHMNYNGIVLKGGKHTSSCYCLRAKRKKKFKKEMKDKRGKRIRSTSPHIIRVHLHHDGHIQRGPAALFLFIHCLKFICKSWYAICKLKLIFVALVNFLIHSIILIFTIVPPPLYSSSL